MLVIREGGREKRKQVKESKREYTLYVHMLQTLLSEESAMPTDRMVRWISSKDRSPANWQEPVQASYSNLSYDYGAQYIFR
jgi:hypothetical protein